MSALDSARALNALNLKPTSAVAQAASTKHRDPLPDTRDETGKARFARLLDHSRAAAAAAQQPPGRSAREATDSASPRRTDRQADKDQDSNTDTQTEAAPSLASNERPGPSARSRSARDDAANEAPDQAADGSVSDEVTGTAPARDADGHPLHANGGVSDLAAMLGLGRPLATTVPPPGSEAAVAAGDVASDATSAVATPLTSLDQAGIDAPAHPAADAEAADALAATSTGERGLRLGVGQAPQPPVPVDPKVVMDATAHSNVLPNAALAHMAGLALGVGKSDEGPKTPFALDALPSGASAPLAGHGVASLARSLDNPASASATVPTPVGDPGFHEDLAAQVSVFARAGLSKAELHLNPAELGPVSVHIMMNGDQARVDFGADRAQTRQAIEAGWAELATSLKDAGFTLSGGGVSEQAQRQAAERQATPQGPRSGRAVAVDDVPAASIVAARPRAGSALDLYV